MATELCKGIDGYTTMIQDQSKLSPFDDVLPVL